MHDASGGVCSTEEPDTFAERRPGHRSGFGASVTRWPIEDVHVHSDGASVASCAEEEAVHVHVHAQFRQFRSKAVAAKNAKNAQEMPANPFVGYAVGMEKAMEKLVTRGHRSDQWVGLEKCAGGLQGQTVPDDSRRSCSVSRVCFHGKQTRARTGWNDRINERRHSSSNGGSPTRCFPSSCYPSQIACRQCLPVSSGYLSSVSLLAARNKLPVRNAHTLY